jgi:hypothetical protein
MGFATTLEHTALTIDLGLLDECLRIWRLRDFRDNPPDPHTVIHMSEARSQVLTLAEIYRWYADAKKRQALVPEQDDQDPSKPFAGA